MVNQSKHDIRHAVSDEDFASVFPVMHVLRPHLASAGEFLLRARCQEEQSGWRLIYVEDEDAPVACAGFRISEWLAWGRVLYVDDLVALESHRGKGFAEALMRWMLEHAKSEGCAQFHLDSGTQRLPAHRFYHRLGLAITSFHFARIL
jgi:GNAT superfamily N-acetyltransferase